ncbi:hypothetical protein, partial [Hyphomicrobium sulfonivorans]|uniref:hypothetical protein n=1 Tax=Hyphomicrobium sulfonivorans TaxID=121290 RepID=UPI001AEC3AD8
TDDSRFGLIGSEAIMVLIAASFRWPITGYAKGRSLSGPFAFGMLCVFLRAGAAQLDYQL